MRLKVLFSRFNLETMRLTVKVKTITINVWRWLKFKVTGIAYWCRMKLRGWTGSLPFYLFNCVVHGPCVDYIHGFPGHQHLTCPKCFNHEAEVKQKNG